MQTAAIYWTRYKRRRVREKPEPESSYGPVGARTALEIARACEPTLELEIVCPGNKVSFCKARQNRERACATLNTPDRRVKLAYRSGRAMCWGST